MQDESWEIPDGTDQWAAIRAADAYLRVRLGLGKRCHAGVFDERGHIFEPTLTAAHREWEKERAPLKSVVISYGNTTEDLYANLEAENLLESPDAILLRPRIRIAVNGIDAAEVRGIGLEAMDKAKRGILIPTVEIPEIDTLTPPHVAPAAPLPNLSEYLASEPEALSEPSLWRKLLNAALAQQILAGLAVTAILALVALIVRSLS